MHTRLFGLFLVVGLFLFGLTAGFLLLGAYCAAAVFVLGTPLLLLALWDHVATEHRIRQEHLARHGGFQVRPVVPLVRRAEPGPNGRTDSSHPNS